MEIKTFYDKVREFPVDFNEKNLTNQYLKFADTEGKIDDTLNYTAVRKDDFKKDPQNLFHIAVSVQLSATSPIVPFAATYSDQQETADTCRSNLQNMLQNKEIKYTAVDMIRDLEALRGRKIVRAYLQTKWSNEGDLLIPEIQFDGPKFMSDTHWFKKKKKSYLEEEGGDEKYENEKAENLIREIQQQSNGVLLTDETSFVYAIANEYKAITGNKTLYFTITCLDRNLDNKSWQTILTTIGTDSKEFEEFFLQRIIEVREIANCLRTRYIDDLLKKNKLETEKSAKAAIMARNMSHNIGSHVMSYLKQNLGSVQEMLRTGVLSELVKEGAFSQNNEGKTILKKGDKDEVVENIALPFLMGMGHFISYIQERQDFIATIATDHIPYYSTLNFKDDIYDVLNPDKRVERHPDRSSSMATDNILLGNIARSENLGRITSSTKGRNLSDIVLKFRTSFNGSKPDPGTIAEAELDEMRNYNVSLPGGILGRQAVFSIFENIIRNAAKHGSNRFNEKLEFTVDLFTKEEITNKKGTMLDKRLPNDDNEEGCLSMRQVLEKFYLSASDSDDHYFLTITDNRKTSLEKLGKLRCALQDDFVETQGSKGLKEMRISSAWIRSIRNEADCFCPKPEVPQEELKKAKKWEKDGEWCGNPFMPAPLVYARAQALKAQRKENAGEHCDARLQYIFCIPIPRIVAVVSNKLTKDTIPRVKSMLADLNWRVFSYEEFEKEWNKTFDFILCEDDLYHDIRQIASARTFSFSRASINGDKLIEEIKQGSIEKDEAKEYEKGLYQLLAKEGPKDIISIDDKDCPKEVEIREDYYDKKIHIADGKIDSAYVYRRHHESEKEFHDFMGMGKTPVFVEGISGGNSTDRLVRHGEWDDIWYYRHLHAMKQQVAVIDERLFPKITGKEAAMFNGPNEVWADGYKALTYLQKGIYPFTLISRGNKYYLIGCVCTKDSNGRLIPVTNDKYECLCKRLAEITYNDQGLEIAESYLDNHFDYITIHQGLLDKMYELFGVKDNPLAKIDITTGFFNKWSSQKEEKPYEGGFHPGLVIHSGRSKPTYNDMPQQLPFIQYAALEHAVADCKFTLVELLDFARYSLYL